MALNPNGIAGGILNGVFGAYDTVCVDSHPMGTVSRMELSEEDRECPRLEFLEDLRAAAPSTVYHDVEGDLDLHVGGGDERREDDGYRVGEVRAHQTGSRRLNGGSPPSSSLTDGMGHRDRYRVGGGREREREGERERRHP